MPMRRRVHRRRGVRLTVGLLFAAALSFTAGLTDVVGFLLAGDFVSFMSGNTTRLAISISQGDEARILHLAAVIAGFVVGNAAGVLIMRWTRGSHAALLVGLAALMTGATLTGETTLTVLALVFSMGALNVALEEVAGHSVGVTYVTGALSRFGRGLGRTMLGEAATGWWIQIVPWIGMIAGALAGAFLWREIDQTAIFAAAFAAALVGLASLAIPRRWRLGYLMRKPSPRRVPVALPRDAAPA
jgi:uncharacterized membrane protein YoaK (UPF0700 family)